MSDTLTVTGVCNEISEKNGWTAFHIDKGSQYPVKLSTKLAPLIEQGRGAGQELATWTYTEVESDKINEHTGKPYVNRYLEGVEVGGSSVVPDTPPQRTTTQAASANAPTHAPLPPGDKDRAITRMAVLKAAAEVGASIEYAPGEDVAAEVIAMAARFETWVYRDTSEIPFG